MHSKSNKNSLRKDVYLLMGALLLSGLLIVPFAQLGQAQDSEGLVRLHASEEFRALMEENPEAARERFEEGIYLSYKGERPIRVRLYSAVVQDGEIQRQYLSETAVPLEPGTTRSLAESGEELFPGSQWVPGSQWLPGSDWIPGSDWLPGSDWMPEPKPRQSWIPNGLMESMKEAIVNEEAGPLLYLIAVPIEEFSRRVGSLPLVVGGPEARIPGSNWVPGDSWIPSSNW